MTGVVYNVSICDTMSPPMMVMPSGRRISEPGPYGDGERDGAEQRRQRRHQDGAEAGDARLVYGDRRLETALALAVEREVDHHDPVLLDDADEQDDADERRHRQLHAGDVERQQRAEPGRGQASR